MSEDRSEPPQTRRGYFHDVDVACRRWLEKRGLMLTREEAALMTKQEVRSFRALLLKLDPRK